MLWITTFYFVMVTMPLVAQGAEGEMPVQIARSALSQHLTVASMIKFFLDLALARYIAPRGTKMSARSCLIVALNRGADLIWIFMFFMLLKMVRDSGGVNPTTTSGKLLNTILGVSHSAYAPPLTQGEQAIRIRRSMPVGDPWSTLETWNSLLSQTESPPNNFSSTVPPFPDFEDLGELGKEFADFEDLDEKLNYTGSPEVEQVRSPPGTQKLVNSTSSNSSEPVGSSQDTEKFVNSSTIFPGLDQGTSSPDAKKFVNSSAIFNNSEQVSSSQSPKKLFDSSAIYNSMEQEVGFTNHTAPVVINPGMERENVSSPTGPASSTPTPIHSSMESGSSNMTQEKIKSVINDIQYTPLNKEEGASRGDDLPRNSTRVPSTTTRPVEPPATSKVLKASQEQTVLTYNNNTFDDTVYQREDLDSPPLPEGSTMASVKQMGEVMDPQTPTPDLVLNNSNPKESSEHNSNPKESSEHNSNPKESSEHNSNTKEPSESSSSAKEPSETSSTSTMPNLAPEGLNQSLGAGSIPKLQPDLETANPKLSSTQDNRHQLGIEPTSASLESSSNSNYDSVKLNVSLKSADGKKGRFVTYLQQELLAWRLVAALVFCAFLSLILTTLCLIHMQVKKVNDVEMGAHIYETPL